MIKNLKRRLLGSPIASALAHSERINKRRALAVFSSDALSSVAYATQEILLVLVLAGGAALSYSIPISGAIICLLFLVVVSYRQTIREYPNGGGAFSVTKENLGPSWGLVAGAALLIDYVLTVAVSVAAGVAALTSAFPSLFQYKITICAVAIGVLTIANLRGVRESATIFAFPTYGFIVGILSMLAIGTYKLYTGEFTHIDPPATEGLEPLTVFLLLHAFSSGCTAMTGVEAVANGVPVFQPPESKNASKTLIIMACLLTTMFFGITYLSHYHGIAPNEQETVLSQLARSIYGSTWPYYSIQILTMGILFLAANTSYAAFPRLGSLLAKDRYLPRQFASLGDRLVFSNGILILGVVSTGLIYLFDADTHALIPLYAVGVFLSFTLSQAGMLRHWERSRARGWIRHAIVSGIGMTVTAVVTTIILTTKFTDGAWLITIAVPALIILFRQVHHHYLSVGKQLSLVGVDPKSLPHELKHTVLLPISGVHRGVIEAMRYAQSIATDVRAVYVEIDKESTERFQQDWQRWGRGVPLVVLRSPYRSVVTPLLRYIDEVEDSNQDDMITVIIPEFVTAKWWQQFLHNQTALIIRAALLFKRNKVVTSVRYHLD
ncbi:MAG TPA: APC family permease [Oligoflexia bacterium]|nr:APC family permease [Oligoflexia bacterium]